MKTCLIKTIILLLLLMVPLSLQAQPTPLEMKNIHVQVGQSFKEFLQLWQEERYFELYELGTKQAKRQLKTEEYATRMVELNWVPKGVVEDEPMDIAFRFRTMIYVKATIAFQHKTKGNLKFKKRQTFLLLMEEKKWRFNLLQMIRSPFYSPEQARPLEAMKKEAAQ